MNITVLGVSCAAFMPGKTGELFLWKAPGIVHTLVHEVWTATMLNEAGVYLVEITYPVFLQALSNLPPALEGFLQQTAQQLLFEKLNEHM